VLEIGCGGGDFSAWMAANGTPSVLGEDFSPVAIAAARVAHSAPGLDFAVGDIESVAHPDDSFDLVVSCETIEHVRHPRQAVSELARVLRPGGTLLLSTPNYLSITGAHRVFREATGRKWDEGGQPIVNWTLYPRTARWIRRAGLKIVSTRGAGWYVPVRGRPGGLPLEPSPWLRRWVKLLALHVLIEARKP
jgi:SAM-dependent methyltransferase